MKGNIYMKNDTISLLIIALCIVMSGIFSASETAFSSMNKIRLKTLAEKNNTKAQLAYKLSLNYDNLLSTILIGNNIVNIAIASLSTVIFVKYFGAELGPTLSTLITTIVVLIFGEISPKSLAKESPEKFVLLISPIMKFFVFLFTPCNFLFTKWKTILSTFITPEKNNGITEDELITIIEEAEQAGEFDKQEGSLIKSAIEFNDLQAIDICTPKINIVGITCRTGIQDITNKFAETGYSRFPVFSDDMEHIIGILYHKDFYNALNTGQLKSIENIMRKPVYITPNINIRVLLKKLQDSHSHIAIIIDEYGCISGLVTLEDILEELVGEIWDEHDTVIYEITETAPNEFEILGSTSMNKVCDILNFENQTFDALTISGWVMQILNKIPQEGDSFEYQNYIVTISKMVDLRIDLLHVKKI